MYNLKEFTAILEEYAPLKISLSAIESGDYDNSGVIVDSHDSIEKVLFTLDLSLAAVERAKELGVDTIVTHHPAIYRPIKSLSRVGETAALLSAVRQGLNIISMHLNLDMAENGVDQSLAIALGGKEVKSVTKIGDYGYGKEFDFCGDLDTLKATAEETLKTERVITYGGGAVKKVASFCGGGSSVALEAVLLNKTEADTIVTSDMPHHVIKELIESGKKILIIPHYSSEQYGFNKFYEWTLQKINGKAKAYYFEDKRFM